MRSWSAAKGVCSSISVELDISVCASVKTIIERQSGSYIHLIASRNNIVDLRNCMIDDPKTNTPFEGRVRHEYQIIHSRLQGNGRFVGTSTLLDLPNTSSVI